MQIQGQVKVSIDCPNLTMIQVDFIQMDDYPADSCAINPAAFLLYVNCSPPLQTV